MAGKISELTASAALDAADLLEVVQGGGNFKLTGTQLRAFAQGGVALLDAANNFTKHQVINTTGLGFGSGVEVQTNDNNSPAFVIVGDADDATPARFYMRLAGGASEIAQIGGSQNVTRLMIGSDVVGAAANAYLDFLAGSVNLLNGNMIVGGSAFANNHTPSKLNVINGGVWIGDYNSVQYLDIEGHVRFRIVDNIIGGIRRYNADAVNGGVVLQRGNSGVLTDALTVDHQGEVYIASSSNNYGHLFINGSTFGSLIDLQQGGNTYGRLYGNINYTALGTMSASPLLFKINDAEVGRFGPNGYFGVNNQNPQLPLDVNGLVAIRSATDATDALLLGAYSDGNTYFDAFGAGAGEGGFVFRTNDAATTALTILPGGDLGIGSSVGDLWARGYTRSVGINSGGTTSLSINGTTYSIFDMGANGVRTTQISAEPAVTTIATLTNIPLNFGTNNNFRMQIAADGSVGIGTASGTRKLNIEGDNAAVSIRDDSGSEMILQTQESFANITTTSALPLRLGTNNSSRIYIDQDGNVGIGVGPTFPLDVVGQVRVSSTISGLDSCTIQPFIDGQTYFNAFGEGAGEGGFTFRVADASIPALIISPAGLLTLGYGGDITPAAAPAVNAIGYLGSPQIQDFDTYTLVMADAGKHYYHTSATPHTLTIPANGSVAYPIGTVIAIVNENGAGSISLVITTDTLRWGSSTGSRTIAANGTATLLKVAATIWRLTGEGIT